MKKRFLFLAVLGLVCCVLLSACSMPKLPFLNKDNADIASEPVTTVQSTINMMDLEGVYTAITLIGAVVGKEDEAAALVKEMQDTFAEIKEKCEDSGKTIYFEVSPLEWGLWAAGGGSFMDEIAGILGLTNIFADAPAWAEVSEEQIFDLDPDYIVTTSMYWGEGPTPVEEILSRAGWEELTAVKNNQVFNADSNAITRPGPRLMDAVKDLYDFVYGEPEEEAPAA